MNNNKTKKQQEKETLRNNIRNHILNCIKDGTYQAGDRIVETRLAKELDVSQAPVREAILELSVMGLLEEKPYSGTFVRTITPTELEDIFQCRAVIESYSIRQAVRHATVQQLQYMKSLVEDMKSCTNIKELTAMDKLFHEAIMDAADNLAMKRVWSSVRMSEWTYFSVASTSLSMEEICSEHEKIYEYINSRDEEGASAFMFLHIKHFGDDLVRLYLRKEASLY